MALAVWVDRRTERNWREVERTDEGVVTLRAGHWMQLNGQPIWVDDSPTTEVQVAADLLTTEYRAS